MLGQHVEIGNDTVVMLTTGIERDSSALLQSNRLSHSWRLRRHCGRWGRKRRRRRSARCGRGGLVGRETAVGGRVAETARGGRQIAAEASGTGHQLQHFHMRHLHGHADRPHGYSMRHVPITRSRDATDIAMLQGTSSAIPVSWKPSSPARTVRHRVSLAAPNAPCAAKPSTDQNPQTSFRCY